ncbi:MAG TPA: hypothetical protein VF422_00825 [Dokdonella sp.]
MRCGTEARCRAHHPVIGRPSTYEHEVGAAVGDAAVDEARDARMLQQGEDAPLACEALALQGAFEPGAHELQRDLLRVRAIGALGQPDDGHAATAEFTQQPPGADLLACSRRLGNVLEGLGVLQPVLLQHCVLEESADARLACEQVEHERGDARIAGLRAHPGFAIGCGSVERGVEQALDRIPAWGVRGGHRSPRPAA